MVVGSQVILRVIFFQAVKKQAKKLHLLFMPQDLSLDAASGKRQYKEAPRHTVHLLSVPLRPARTYFRMFSLEEGYVIINEVGFCQFSTPRPPSFTKIY